MKMLCFTSDSIIIKYSKKIVLTNQATLQKIDTLEHRTGQSVTSITFGIDEKLCEHIILEVNHVGELVAHQRVIQIEANGIVVGQFDRVHSVRYRAGRRS